MAYLTNKSITIASKDIVLLLDNYGPKNRKDLNILDTSPGFSFSFQHDELVSIRKIYPKNKVYGFWQLLFLSKHINLATESGFFVVFKDDGAKDGFFLYYNKPKSEFVSGLVIANRTIGAFHKNIKDAFVINVKLSSITLPEEVLLPVEKQKLQQKLQQKSIITTLVAIIIIATIFFTSYQFFFDAKGYQNKLNKKLKLTQQQLTNNQKELKILKKNRIKLTMSEDLPPLFMPLVILSSLNVQKLKFELPFESKELSINFKKLEPWMVMLPNNVFKLSKKSKHSEVNITWQH